MRFNGQLSAEISEKMNGTKRAVQPSFSLACDLSRSDCLLKGMWLSSVGRHFFFPPHTAPANRWSLFPSDPSKEMTLIRPKCSIIYSLLASPCNSLPRLNKGGGRGVKTTCHESHMQPNLHSLMSFSIDTVCRLGDDPQRSVQSTVSQTDLEPPLDVAFVDLSGKWRTRIYKYRHTDNPAEAHTQAGETLETQFGHSGISPWDRLWSNSW